MLEEMCRECRNWFTPKGGKHCGTFTIKDGIISPLDFVYNNQYFRIVGSCFNDGVHQNASSVLTSLTDEVFDGQIWAMNVPPAFIALSGEIEEYRKKYESDMSPYNSESFGAYSYSKATDKDGLPLSWQKVFANKLNIWRKI